MRNLLILSIILSSTLDAQIPNPGFESWVVGNWLLEPEGWDTPNDQFNAVVYQDTDPYQGDFAMRVEAVPDGIGEYGWAECVVPIDYIPASLDFFVKAEVEFGGVNVTISFFNDDFLFNSFDWNSGTSLEEWTPISIEMVQNEPVLTHALIRVEAQVGDLVPGNAWISVDAMGFDGPLSVTPNSMNRDFEFYPNPVNDRLSIKNGDGYSTIRILNLTGQIVYESTTGPSITEVDVSHLTPGLYLLGRQTAGGEVNSHKLVIE